MYDQLVKFIKNIYPSSNSENIFLHEPKFTGNEKKYLSQAIDSTFVSSVGAFVNRFEQKVCDYTGANFCIATVNGTSALHTLLLINGVSAETEVITQSLTFVGTINAIIYCGAAPVFIDVDSRRMSMSAQSLQEFLENKTEIRNDGMCWNKITKKRISACMPMHTFGFPADMKKIEEICKKYNIVVIEDAAEALGSWNEDVHAGAGFSTGVISFNGNKIITSGGGGMIMCSSEEMAIRAKHITTTARTSSGWHFEHDQVGFNYRLPNINAALGLAQMEQLPDFVQQKRAIAELYQSFGKSVGLNFFVEDEGTCSNYWLNCLRTKDVEDRDNCLSTLNNNGILARPIWKPMHLLPMFQKFEKTNLEVTEMLFSSVVSLPSGVGVNDN